MNWKISLFSPLFMGEIKMCVCVCVRHCSAIMIFSVFIIFTSHRAANKSSLLCSFTCNLHARSLGWQCSRQLIMELFRFSLNCDKLYVKCQRSVVEQTHFWVKHPTRPLLCHRCSPEFIINLSEQINKTNNTVSKNRSINGRLRTNCEKTLAAVFLQIVLLIRGEPHPGAKYLTYYLTFLLIETHWEAFGWGEHSKEQKKSYVLWHVETSSALNKMAC